MNPHRKDSQMAAQKIFTTGQVAKICRVAPRTVSKWFDAGRLKGYRIPGSQDRRIPREQLIRFMKENQMPLGDLVEDERYKILALGFGSASRSLFDVELPAGDFITEHAAGLFEAGIAVFGSRPNAIVFDFRIGRGEAIAVTKRIRSLDPHYAPLIAGICADDETEHGRWELLKKHQFDLIASFDALQTISERIREHAEAIRDN